MDLELFKNKITEYGQRNGYTPTTFDIQTCSCGHKLFEVYSDDTEGGCGISCSKCKRDKPIEDSDGYMEDIIQNICTCGSEELYVMVAKAYYQDSNDVRWVYVGGLCPKCNLAGVYVDWAQR